VQSESTTQSPLQAVGPHVKGAQATSCSAGQPPAPSHETPSTATSELHDGSRQLVPEPGYAHAFAFVPSHAPPQRLPSDAQTVRAFRGTPATGVHVPALPASAHASH
jgi:hypothetical protein